MRGNAGVPVVDPIFAAGLVPRGDHWDGDEAAGVFKIRQDSRSREPGLGRCPSVNTASFVLTAGSPSSRAITWAVPVLFADPSPTRGAFPRQIFAVEQRIGGKPR